jgi:PAS domain S-box-containing protein
VHLNAYCWTTAVVSEGASVERSARILFVEDEQTVREHLAAQLSNEYIVETAGDGEEALKAVLRNRPDLLITDLVMPTLNGVELVRMLRATPSTSSIPILMLSGRAPDELRLDGFELGADAFLAKPYTERELRVRIRSLLRTTDLRANLVRTEARRRMEHEALAERAALLESISDAFYALDREWRITYVNQRALDYFGMPRETVIDRNLWELLPVGKGTRIEEEYRRAMTSGQRCDFEILSPHSHRWVEVHVYPTPQGIAVNFRDITDRKRSEAALRELTATLEQRVRSAVAERDQAWNNTQDMLAVVSKDGIFRAANPAWTTVLEWHIDEIVGRSYLDLIHPEDHREAVLALARAAERPLRNFESRFRRKSGVFRHISWVAAPAGELIYASGRDVSPEKEAVEALRQANARTRTVFETSYQYQGFIDAEGILRDANLTSLLDIRSDLKDVVGKYFWDTPWFQSTPGVAEDVRADIERVKKGQSIQRELTLNLPIGRRCFDFSMRAALDDQGAIVGIVPEAVDITDRKSNAEQLAHMQKMETIGQLTGNVAHDFNNLLTPIVGALDLLHRKYGADERAQKFTGGALQAAERARLLVQKLLAFARKQHLEARAVDVKQLLEDLVDLLSRSIGSRIQIEMDVADGLPAAHVDPNQLELALLNLALNARDAMPEGGTLRIAAMIERSTREGEAPRFISISVIDTGQGMDAMTLKRAIEPFYTTKPSGQGTGLGLSMVHGLAAQSGGELLLSSESGRGTTATLRLPLSLKAAEKIASVFEGAIAPTHAVTILVVDDEELVRSSTAAMLEDAGYTVIEAPSGARALELLNENTQVQAVITDYAMPGMTGVQLATAIRKRQATIPILMITGFAHLAESEVDGLPRLAKPFKQTELIARLVEVFRAREPA